MITLALSKGRIFDETLPLVEVQRALKFWKIPKTSQRS
jgi:hypothetical protein